MSTRTQDEVVTLDALRAAAKTISPPAPRIYWDEESRLRSKLNNERAPCCGEVGHAQVHVHEWVTGNGFLECAGCGKEKLDPEYIP